MDAIRNIIEAGLKDDRLSSTDILAQVQRALDAAAGEEFVSVPKKHLAAVLDYLHDEREHYDACPPEEREQGHIWLDVSALLPFVTLACNCGGNLCEGETFTCATCARRVPNCRGAADKWPDDCDDCVSRLMEAMTQ
jgi:hypothetical protein